MAEIIDIAEARAERRRERAPGQESLEGAVLVLKASLAAAAQSLAEAQREEEAELLVRVERLTAMVRYGLRMLGHPTGPGPDEPRFGHSS
jgi:hypothetical protein